MFLKCSEGNTYPVPFSRSKVATSWLPASECPEGCGAQGWRTRAAQRQKAHSLWAKSGSKWTFIHYAACSEFFGKYFSILFDTKSYFKPLISEIVGSGG